MKFENIVTHLSIFDVEAKEIPCFTGVGAPTTATVGDVGCFYMDTLSGEVYKCTAVDIGETEEDSIFTWEFFRSGSEIVMTEGTGSSYTATVSNIKTLTAGVNFIMIPHITNVAGVAKLNVNGLGEKNIAHASTNSANQRNTITQAGELIAGYPYRVMYNGSEWVAVDRFRIDAASITSGRVAVSRGGVPAVTTENNGQFLWVEDGVPTWVKLTAAEDVEITIAEEITFNG